MKHQLLVYSTDMCRSMEFYWGLFGVEPVRLSDDMLGFDVEDPALYLTVKRWDRDRPYAKRSGVVWIETNGFVVTAWDRLEAEGLITRDERSVGCFYPSNNRLWVIDPDGNRWNFFIPELPASEAFRLLPAPPVERPMHIIICFADTGYYLPSRCSPEEQVPCEALDEGAEDAS